MGSKLIYAALGSFLVLCLAVFSVYAVTSSNIGEFTVTPDVLYVTWQDADTGFGCYANNTTIINNLGTSLNVTISNSTGVGGIGFYVNNGDTNSTIINLGSGATKYPVLKFSPGSALNGTYTANVTVYNTTNSTEDLEFTVKVVVPQSLQNLVNVYTIPKANLGQNIIVLANFSVNNTESYPLVITDVDNRTSLWSGTHHMNYTHTMTLPITVPANTNATYQASINVNTAGTGNTVGIYTDQIKITSANGCPNQTYNITISANLTNHLDVTVTNGSSILTNTGENITLRVTPKYLNGTYIIGLDKTNFTVTLEHRYDDNLTTSAIYTTTIPTATDSGTYYTINATLPSVMLGGDYRVKVTTIDALNSGTGYYDYYTVQKTALKLVHTLDCDGVTYDIGDTITCTHRIYNYGNVTATAVNLTYTGCSNYLTASSYTGTIESIEPGTYASKAASFEADAATTGCFLSFEAVAANGVWDNNLRTTDLIIKVRDTEEIVQTSTSETPGSGSSHKLTVTPPADFSAEQGESATKSVVVKNTGGYTERNVALTLSGMDSSWYSVGTEAQTIVVTLEKNYIVSFIIPDDAEPTEYSITYKAKSDATEGTATGKIKVMPSDETEAEILKNLTEYQEWYGSVLKMFNETKMSGGNSTELDGVETMLEQITGLLTKADSHIKLGEYYEAYQTLKEARILLEEAEDSLTGEKSRFEDLIFDKFIIVGAGITIAVVFAGIYFFRQRGGYRPYKPRRGNLHLHGKRKVAGMKLKFEHFKHEMKRKKDRVLSKV